MTTSPTAETVVQYQVMEAQRGLRSVARDLQHVAQDFYAMGEDMLADEANILCRQVGDLLNVVSTA